MIIEFGQVSLQPNPVYKGKIGDNIAVMGQGRTKDVCPFINGDNEAIFILDNMLKEKINGKYRGQITHLYKGDVKIGYIYPDLEVTKKVLFIETGFVYYALHYKGEDYKIYEIIPAKDKQYYCVHKNDETIAIIQKNKKNDIGCNTYTIYALFERDKVMLCTLAYLFENVYESEYDIDIDCPDEEFIAETDENILSKYDKDFIKKIINIKN